MLGGAKKPMSIESTKIQTKLRVGDKCVYNQDFAYGTNSDIVQKGDIGYVIADDQNPNEGDYRRLIEIKFDNGTITKMFAFRCTKLKTEYKIYRRGI